MKRKKNKTFRKQIKTSKIDTRKKPKPIDFPINYDHV